MKTVTVAEYRDLIDACFQSHRDFYACVSGHEQRMGIEMLSRHIEELKAASCKRASAGDASRAADAIRSCGFLVCVKTEQFDAADVAFTRMAFAGEWK